MKLLCVTASYWPAIQYGGPIHSVHSLNQALVKKGVDVTVYTTNVGLKHSVPANQEINVDGVKVTYFSYTNLFEMLGAAGWQFSLPLTKALKRNLRAFHLVYVVGTWNYPVMAVCHYCSIYGKDFIISPRGHLYPEMLKTKSWKKWPYYALFLKRYLAKASAIHYTTEDEAEKCHKSLALKPRPFVVPNGIDFSEMSDSICRNTLRKRYPHLNGKKIILFMSRLNWKKGIDILIRAYSSLARQRDDLHLLIVGGDDDAKYAQKVKAWIRDSGMKYVDYGLVNHSETVGADGAMVTFTGLLAGKEKLETLAGSDIFVLPSLSENFGMAVVEAMAMGLPVIITNRVGIHREVTKAKAGIVIDLDAVRLSKAIDDLSKDPEMRKAMGENGQRIVRETFLLDQVATQMIEVYKAYSDESN